ncbi:EmrB/QacA subfamily drug resistance transporter [Phyllobacterium ifriqiyense]|uniref:EmrB/QacA subfamily drug resistance transporter n=1 Tax=Phyllobacterium ifriqiyense TaxID=314238 RepID=A0ABU0SC14_9HYPH|nr:DHA2 family efflux MFS transporter permease subunit [Phyllobacterium ifriqiyense]MDQ0998304.1 EmrB/QacA subfamily drug resistance transporter [Phyllobacterium ifriqiyense]
MNRVIPLVLAVALFMEQMDSTVISTSLPAIAADIGTSPIALKLALTAYLVSLAVFIPVSGWMADRFGAKNVFRAAIVVFVLGSIACAVSNSLLAFVVSRFLQGVGGAMMTPVGRLVLVRSTPRNELVGAMAWLTMPALIGPLLGPPVGGFLTTYFSWHWIFLINVPIGIIGIWFATRYLPSVETLVRRPLDVIGFFLSGIAASGVVFGLSVVSLPALPSWVGLTTLAVGLVSTVLYLFHARNKPEPLLALDLFKNQVFRASIVGGSLFRIGVGAVPFLLPLMFQIGFGMTPFQSGMITFVSALGAMSMKLVTKWFYAKTGFRNSLMYGSVVAAVFIAVNGLFTPATPYWLMILLLLAGGFFRSLFFTGTNALAYADIPNEQTSQATPISSVAQQISIALGVAVAGGILEVSTKLHGGPLQLSDFHTAFFIVAAVSGLACLSFRGLKADAGAEVSGHRPRIKVVSPAE